MYNSCLAEDVLYANRKNLLFFQSAQRRLRAMIQSALMTTPVNGNGPIRVGSGGDSNV